MNRTPPDEVSFAAAPLKALSRLRHDIRSALAPAQLAADLLAAQPDERTRRYAATVQRAIEKTLERLEATRAETAPPEKTESQDSP